MLIVRYVWPKNGYYADGGFEKYLTGGNWVQISREVIDKHLLDGGAVWSNPTDRIPRMEMIA